MPKRGISIESHASTDVVLVIALLALPSAFGFAGLNAATAFTWGAALLGLLMYLLNLVVSLFGAPAFAVGHKVRPATPSP